MSFNELRGVIIQLWIVIAILIVLVALLIIDNNNLKSKNKVLEEKVISLYSEINSLNIKNSKMTANIVQSWIDDKN